MIISASRRTDIPAFYGRWFLNRIKEGYVTVKNPFNSTQERRIDLSPQNVDIIVFWTKNPKPFIPELAKLDDYFFYFLCTITPYGIDLEPNVPDLKQKIETFKKLSDTIGPERVILRYDPIILTNTYTENFHYQKFGEIAEQLSGYTHRCIFSFAEWYARSLRNMLGILFQKPNELEMHKMVKAIVEIASEYNLKIQSCAMPCNFSEEGAQASGCIDAQLIQAISGKLILQKPDPNQRKYCLCNQSIDIGAYNTCIHGCKYCYANHSCSNAVKKYLLHNPMAPFLD